MAASVNKPLKVVQLKRPGKAAMSRYVLLAWLALGALAVLPAMNLHIGRIYNKLHNGPGKGDAALVSSGVKGTIVHPSIVLGNDNSSEALNIRPAIRYSVSWDVTSLFQEQLLQNLKIPWSELDFGEPFDEGAYGAVYRASWHGNPVVAKLLFEGNETCTAFRREILLMTELRHPSLAVTYGLVDDEEICALVMKHYSPGCLFDVFNTTRYQQLSITHQLRFALQIASGVLRLHQAKPAPIVHGDIKTGNILLEDDWQHVVLADFGLATTEAPDSYIPPTITAGISPPELIKNVDSPRARSMDVYSFGMTLLEILQGIPLFPEMEEDDIANFIMEGKRPEIPGWVPKEVAGLIQACWSEIPGDRPNFDKIVSLLTHYLDSLGSDAGDDQGSVSSHQG